MRNMVNSQGTIMRSKIDVEIREQHSFVTHVVFKTPCVLNLISYIYIDMRP